MALTADFASRIITSDASITDVVAFHLALRDVEDDSAAMIHPVIHTYKEIDLGSGAKFPAVAFINGWTLQFPAGNFEIRGGNVAAVLAKRAMIVRVFPAPGQACTKALPACVANASCSAVRP